MSQFKTTTHALFGIACAIIIHSKSFAEPQNLALLKETIKTYHDSNAYLQELTTSISSARDYIDERSNIQNQASEKLAIVLDIDETSLSNYDNIVSRDFAYDQKKLNEEVLAANAPAIAPMLELYQDALRHHVAVFFVTGRSVTLKSATSDNLKTAGYNTWAGLYLRPNSYKESSIVPFKTQARADITHKGYTIIASIGDQTSDLTGGYAEKTFKLPNPYYYIQ